jgi:hypothetical protein
VQLTHGAGRWGTDDATSSKMCGRTRPTSTASSSCWSVGWRWARRRVRQVICASQPGAPVSHSTSSHVHSRPSLLSPLRVPTCQTTSPAVAFSTTSCAHQDTVVKLNPSADPGNVSSRSRGQQLTRPSGSDLAPSSERHGTCRAANLASRAVAAAKGAAGSMSRPLPCLGGARRACAGWAVSRAPVAGRCCRPAWGRR